ncbi:hypothetical protein B0A54_11714 [Friedmanniomyces endolithicus]|uniref:Uncharacterized protein n=1 Tax=Friedmanniomyces endolithicus TaxID=329885 RepID=A0A4U0UPA8_9PEZI|nr:hypothetical protein B0A54_11714 [Friedmanniomyces endolithicus]
MKIGPTLSHLVSFLTNYTLASFNIPDFTQSTARQVRYSLLWHSATKIQRCWFTRPATRFAISAVLMQFTRSHSGEHRYLLRHFPGREHISTVSGYAEATSSAEPNTRAQAAARTQHQDAPTVPASVLTPPYTPAVKHIENDVPGKAKLHAPRATSGNRPVSHLLHTPNEDTVIAAPLTPSRPGSATSVKTPARLDVFALQAIERHRVFVEKETAATSDEERLELFANFMVHESRLRRDRYQAAYNTMAGDVVDLTRDMWRSYTKNSKRAVTPSTSMSSFDPTAQAWGSDGQPSSANGGLLSSASSLDEFTPATDTASVDDPQDAFDHPNQSQEEGDEHPERLEKLTLLKWLFEAREQLHKEMFDLHAERSEQYSEVILTPYRIQRAQAKIDEAIAFFAKDSRQRQLAFAKAALKRFDDLQVTMERNVSRGVEDQLSAFWDIAPGLLEVACKIPDDLSSFDIHVPSTEYDENPSYTAFPLQYLYSLLSHAEKSAYQFIESQTNLLCLLHEVRTAAAKSNLRLLELECLPAGSPVVTSPAFTSEVVLARREAEERLTADLKEKVGEVEGQWRAALGSGLDGCKGRVREFLEEMGGWEEGLEA